jgi:hypothetical protein
VNASGELKSSKNETVGGGDVVAGGDVVVDVEGGEVGGVEVDEVVGEVVVEAGGREVVGGDVVEGGTGTCSGMWMIHPV